MRTEAGMALWAKLPNFSRFLADGCFFGEEERVPFPLLCDFDLVLLELCFGFGDFLDFGFGDLDCFFELERVSSCGC